MTQQNRPGAKAPPLKSVLTSVQASVHILQGRIDEAMITKVTIGGRKGDRRQAAAEVWKSLEKRGEGSRSTAEHWDKWIVLLQVREILGCFFLSFCVGVVDHSIVWDGKKCRSLLISDQHRQPTSCLPNVGSVPEEPAPRQ